MKNKLAILSLLALAGCANQDYTISYADAPVAPKQTTCDIAPKVIYNNFPNPVDPMLLFDNSLSSGLMLLVVPKHSVIVDVDYGCKFQFTEFAFSNELTSKYKFGLVQVYVEGALVAQMDQGSAIKDGNTWKVPTYATGRMVRYSFTNTGKKSTYITLTDIESGSTLVP